MSDYSTLISMLRELGYRCSWLELNSWTEAQRNDVVVMLDQVMDGSCIDLPCFVQRRAHEISPPSLAWEDGCVVFSISMDNGQLGRSASTGEPLLIAAKWIGVEVAERMMEEYGLEPVCIHSHADTQPGWTRVTFRLAHMPKTDLR